MKILIVVALLANLIVSLAVYSKMARRIELRLTQESCYRISNPNPDQVQLQ